MLQRIRGVIERDPRLSRVLHGGASALLGSVVALGVSAISLPLTVRYLGAEQYGIWVTVSTTVVLMSVLDLGIANSLTNMIAKAFAADDKAAAQRSYATAFWTCSVVSAVAGVVVWALWDFVPWATLFRVHEAQLTHDAEVCAAIAVVFFLVSLPLKLINRVLGGYQETQIANYASLVNSVLGLVAILAVMAFHGSLVELMLVFSAMMLAGTAALNVWVLLWRKRWMTPWPSMVSPGSVRELLGTGSGFLLLQLSALVVFNSDNVVIAHYLGAADVTPYSVTMRLATYATALQIALFPSLWPAYAEAYARGDYEWVRSVFWKAARYAMGAAGIAVVVLASFGRPLIRWYVGQAAVPSEWLILVICFWTLIATAMDLEACLLAAVGRVGLQGALSLVAAVVNVTFSIYLVKRIGSVGVVLGTITSYLLVLVWPQTAMVRKLLQNREPMKGWPTFVGLPLLWTLATLRLPVTMRIAEALGLVVDPLDRRDKESRTILIANLSGFLGDHVMTFPMIEELRAAQRDAFIACAVPKSIAPLMRVVLGIDRVYALNLPNTFCRGRLESISRSWRITREYWNQMRRESFDVCILPRWMDDSFRATVLTLLTRAPERVGFSPTVGSTLQRFREPMLTKPFTGGSGVLEPLRFVLLLQSAGLSQAMTVDDILSGSSNVAREVAGSADWNALAARIGIADGVRFAVIAPGAGAAARRWPIDLWATVARSLQDAGLVVAVLSGASDAEVARSLYSTLSAPKLLIAGVTSIPEKAALLQRSELFLGSDSGPGHIAGSLGVPSVILFIAGDGSDPDGIHSVERMRPLGSDVVCFRPSRIISPCREFCSADQPHCILTITPEQVSDAALSLLRARQFYGRSTVVL